MILPDYPIEDKDNDKLRRAPLAKKVAELVNNFQGKESFVIGIEGVWGSGKTSFINFVVNELKDKENIIFVPFNPWNFAGQNELIADFFATLHNSVKNERGVKDLSKTLRSYASKLQISFSPSIPVPFLGSVGFGELWKKGGTTLQEERKKIDDELKALPKKIVIVIDDIDRLDKEETRLIMKLVKMTANFHNTVFLLAYDRARVAEKLNGEEWSGDEYLKKIVQVSFTLPKPDQQGLQSILFNDLDETIKGVYGEVKLEGEDEKRWGELQYAGFRDFFKTIRDIKRFISSLRLNWSIMGQGDVNMVDFIAIEAIRVFAPVFYANIGANQALFTSGRNYYAGFSSRDDATARKAKYDELLNEVPKELQQAVDKICKVLFPQLDGNHGGDWEQTWRKDLRICSDNKFPFYFQLGIPEGAISESEAKNVIKTLDKKEDFSENLLRFHKEKRLRALLAKLLDHIEGFTEDQVKNLVLSLWDLGNEIDDGRTAVFDFDDVQTQTSRLVYHSIKKNIAKEKRRALLEELTQNAKTLFYPAYFIAIMGDESKKEGRAEEPLLEKVDAEALGKLILGRIKAMATDGTLANEEELSFFLFRWKEWETPEAVTEYLRKLVATKKGLVSFLRGLVGRVLSTAGNYDQLDKKVIEQLIPDSEIEPLVAQITDEDLATFTEKEKEAVHHYRNPRKDRWG